MNTKPVLKLVFPLAFLLGLVLFIVACGDDNTPTQPATGQPEATATATSAPVATPTATQTDQVPVSSRLKVGIVPPLQQTTMMWKTAQSGTGPFKALYEHPIGMNRFTEELTNEQAGESWSMSPDGRTWTFKIKEGIPFHTVGDFSGVEVAAKDYIATFRSVGRDDSLASYQIFKDMGLNDENFEVVSPNELVWKAAKLDVFLPFWLSEQWVAGIISQDYQDKVGGLEQYVENPVGTGPFQFVEIRINEYILHKRVENHWRQTPEFHELQFFYVPEDATRLAQLLAKEVHMADVPKSLLPEATSQGYRVATSTTPGFFAYAFFSGLYYDREMPIRAGNKQGQMEPIAPGYSADDPFRKLEVRKAANLAINRQELLDQFWGEGAILFSVHNMSPLFDYHEGRWDPYPYDPDEAKELLAQAGYPNGFEFTLTTARFSGVPEMIEVSEAVAQYWRSIGMTANIETIPAGDILTKQRNRAYNKGIFFIRYSTYPYRNYLGWTFPMSNVAGGSGSPSWEIPELDDLFLDLKAQIQPDDILDRMITIGDYMYENHLIVPLAYILPEVPYDPSVVQEYLANHLHFGPTRHHEYTKAVFQ
jgi:peptide/nickel transport system substrate-binding protein